MFDINTVLDINMVFDINVVRGLLTLVLMILFVSLCVWVYSPSQKERFEKAAKAPFEEDSTPH